MFRDKNTIRQDMVDFVNNNELIGGRYSLDAVLEYAILVESRIQTNMLLLNNPSLCSQCGIDSEDLYAELENLMEIRQKVSFVDKQNKQTR